MITTTTQDRDFIKHVISEVLLEKSIEWIKANMNPEDVFSIADLDEWAAESGYTREEQQRKTQ